MKLNLKRPLVVFDLETTGLDIVKDHIIQISYIKVEPDGTETRRDFLVNPGMKLAPQISELTGITDEILADKPTFKEISKMLADDFAGCDFAGFNSNHFDVPLLAEEFLRAGISLDFSNRRLIDVQTIFHKMEKRNLAAAYKFYCGRKMEDDFDAHRADQDTEATYKVLMAQLDYYTEDKQRELGEEPEGRVLKNDVDFLADFSKLNDNVDFAGRMVWGDLKDAHGNVVTDKDGFPVKVEYFNFGKYKGRTVAEVVRLDSGYVAWILQGDFTFDTKQALTRIRMRELQKVR